MECKMVQKFCNKIDCEPNLLAWSGVIFEYEPAGLPSLQYNAQNNRNYGISQKLHSNFYVCYSN